MKKFLLLGCSSLILALCGPAMATWETPTDNGNLPNITAAAASVFFPNAGNVTYQDHPQGSNGYSRSWTWVPQFVGDSPGIVNAKANYSVTKLTLTLASSSNATTAYGDVSCGLTVNGTSFTVGDASGSKSNGTQQFISNAATMDTGTVTTYPGNTLTISVDANADADVEVSVAAGDTASAQTSDATVQVNYPTF